VDREALERIDKELGVALPDSYVKSMEDFPIPALAGNADTDLWDDADAIIERNRELREGIGAPSPWPDYLFFIGDPLSMAANAIDLRNDEAPVWWLDHCDVDAAASGEVSPSFAQWVGEWTDTLREDLARDGIDPADASAANGTGCGAVLCVLAATALWSTLRAVLACLDGVD
jgi:hypothetical protein